MPITLDCGETERLVHIYSDPILHPSYAYLKNIDDAQSICQTVFLGLPQKSQAFSPPGHERAQIIRAAASLCKDYLKSGWRRTTAALDAVGAVSVPTEEEGNPLSAVSLLPPKYRIVIHLYCYEGYVIREITRLLDEGPATVSTQLDHGRQWPHTLLESEGMTRATVIGIPRAGSTLPRGRSRR